MSGIAGCPEQGMLGLITSVRGRARRMPKAESDGLAPLLIGIMETLRLGLGVFVLNRSGWWKLLSRGFGPVNAKDRRAGFARRSLLTGSS